MKETVTVLRCDWHQDGTEADRTVPFRDGDLRFELDLCKECRAELRAGARRVKLRTSSAAHSNGNGQVRRQRRGPAPSVIREWARNKGIEISDNGRIPTEIADAYKAAAKA